MSNVSKHIIEMTWEKAKTGNYVLNAKDFYISYRSQDDIYTIDETALTKKDVFYVLNGDFRKEYEALIDKGFKECYKFYLSKKELYQSEFSADIDTNEISIDTILRGSLQILEGIKK